MRRLLFVAVFGMLAVIAFGSTALAIAGPSIVYDSIASPLPPNVPSLGYQATQTAEFGDDIQLAGTTRYLTSVRVTMSDWAKKSDYPGVGTASSWTHPITLNVYNVDTSGAVPALGSLITTMTQTATIPWRPVADPTCATPTAWRAGDGNCYNGLAFNLTFTLPHAFIVPSRIIVSIAYNTNTWGANPIGAPGPYESLNVGLSSVLPTIGTDSESDATFWNTMTGANYTDGGAGGVGTFRRDTNWTPFRPALQLTTDAGCSTTCYVDATNGNDSYTGASSGEAKKTIQAAVDQVSANGTVIAAAGTYARATINKPLTLHGVQAGVDARGRSAAESIVQSATGGPGGSAFSIAADNVTIDGFKLVGVGSSGDQRFGIDLTTGADRSTLHITNSIFLNLYEGIHRPSFSVTGLMVDYNAFTNDPGNQLAQDAGLWLAGSGGASNVTIAHNAFSSMDNNPAGDFSAINLNGGSHATISANTSDHDGSFLVLVNYSDATVSANTTNHEAGSTIFLGLGNDAVTVENNTLQNGFRGVRLSTAFGGPTLTQHVTITGNTITGMGDAGIFVDTGTVSDSVSATLNSISGNAAGLRNSSSQQVAATCNWWGSASGPGPVGAGSGDTVTANVTYTPWLTTSTLTSATCANVAVVGSGAADATGNEGTTIQTSGSFSGTLTSITADHAFGNFTPNAAAGTWTWSYLAPDQFGPTVITVTAHGTNGSTASDAFNASTTNANPTATLSAPASALFNSSFNLSLTGGSDVAADTLSYAFDCGSGSFGAASASGSTTCTAPSTAGPITVQGKVLDEDGGSNTYSTTVTITRQDVSLSPGSRDFGSQLINTSSAPSLFIIKNIGSANLVLGPVSIGGTNSNQFGIADPNNCGGTTLAPNATCNVNVFFHPTSAGGKTGSLVVASNDPDSPSLTATLTGSGVSASQGTITIKLDAHPDGAQAFRFKGSSGIGKFTLTDNGTAANSATFNVGGGDFKFKMTKQAGWAIANITCDTSAVVKPNKRKVTAHVAIGQNATCTFTVTQRKPDAAIATSQAGPYTGVGIYATTALPTQTVNKAVASGQTTSLFATLTNSGLDFDSFKIDANLAGSNNFNVSFFVGATNVTQQVLAGTYTTTLGPGAQLLLEIRVTGKANIPASAARDVDLKMQSATASAAKDVVRAHVTRA